MRSQRPAELVLGSVQLGLEYGAANRTGKPSRETALRLVRRAAESGMTLDTARAYGDSEERIGEALAFRKPVRTITKLSPLADLTDRPSWLAVCAAVDASIEQSRFALQRDKLDCVLLHRASHMTAFDGAVWARLLELRREGMIASLGVSVQNTSEALMALASQDVDHIQLAFNILDWRWREAGVIAAIRRRGDVTVHARSIFLQGLLADERCEGLAAHRRCRCQRIAHSHRRLRRGIRPRKRRRSLPRLCARAGLDRWRRRRHGNRRPARRKFAPLHQAAAFARRLRLDRKDDPARARALLDPAQWPK